MVVSMVHQTGLSTAVEMAYSLVEYLVGEKADNLAQLVVYWKAQHLGDSMVAG
jgi:hypothetical protein